MEDLGGTSLNQGPNAAVTTVLHKKNQRFRSLEWR